MSETDPTTSSQKARPGRVVSGAGSVDVVYIAGDGRSGSTLLSQLLGQVPGWLAAGEVRYVWERGVMQNRVCECGRAFADCPYWSDVLQVGFGGPGGIPVKQIVQPVEGLLRTRRAIGALRGAKRPGQWAGSATEAMTYTGVLYPAMRDVSNCDVIVDSSKLPAYAQLLRSTEALRVAVVHLVRDPRATVHSWRRNKPLHAGDAKQYMRRRSLLESCAVWNSSNLMVEGLLGRHVDRFTRLRYEDLVADPGAALRKVVDDLRYDVEVPDFDGAETHIEHGHAAAGNPARHNRGPLSLKLDDAWRKEMPQHDIAAATALTWPLAKKYGYV